MQPVKPKCPGCSGNQFSFTEIGGPVANWAELNGQFQKLKERHEQQVTAAKAHSAAAQFPESQKKYLQQLNNEFESAKSKLVQSFRDNIHYVCMVHCVKCGYVVGVCDNPSSHSLHAEQVCAAIAEMQTTLVEALTGVKRQVSAINARGQSKANAAQIAASLDAGRQLFGG